MIVLHKKNNKKLKQKCFKESPALYDELYIFKW